MLDIFSRQYIIFNSYNYFTIWMHQIFNWFPIYLGWKVFVVSKHSYRKYPRTTWPTISVLYIYLRAGVVP